MGGGFSVMKSVYEYIYIYVCHVCEGFDKLRGVK